MELEKIRETFRADRFAAEMGAAFCLGLLCEDGEKHLLLHH